MYDRRIKRNYILLLVFGIILFLFSSSKAVQYFFDEQAVKEMMEEVIHDVEIKDLPVPTITVPEATVEAKPNDYWKYMHIPLFQVDFDALRQKNKDTVGWVRVEGTNINYPIVQRPDNEYYLKHAFDGSKNAAGWVFMDYRNNPVDFDRNTILYGHARLEGIMFGSLKNILKSNWYTDTENHVVKISTPTENTLWQVFSVYVIKEESYYIKTKFSSDEQYLQFLMTLQQRSAYSFETELLSSDKILTLSTCYGDNTERVVLHAKLLRTEKVS